MGSRSTSTLSANPVDDAAFVSLGRVVKPHGLTGELSVKLEAGVPGVPVGLAVWFVPPPEVLRTGRVLAVRQGPKGPLVTVEGVSDIATADALRGLSISARSSDLPEDFILLEESLEGLEVSDVERGVIGSIAEIIETGANDVWVVRGGPFGEVLIPVIDDVILEVDRQSGTARVRLLPGLIEEPS